MIFASEILSYRESTFENPTLENRYIYLKSKTLVLNIKKINYRE